ncbi:MAG: TadE/TadG family type IV pilus assembly protein [Hyphomicrobiales bacterium]
MSEIRKVTQLLKRFRGLAHDRRGSIAIIFGLTLIPMATLAGVAVDYANVSRLNARLKAAADAAVLSAVRDYVSTSNLSMAQKKGTDVFNSDLKKTAALQDATISFKDTSSGANVSLTATYSGTVKTWFGGFIQVDKVPLSGSANASYVKQRYKNFYFVVNASESMGIAATQADIDKLKTLTPGSCALACHVPENGAPKSNQQIARENNVTLRLDVIKTAIKDILTQVAADPVSSAYFKFVIYPFAYYRGALGAPSSDFSGLKSQVDAIDLSHTVSPEGFTDHKKALQNLANTIGAGGDGSTAAKAQNFIFLMTDGVEDVANADKRVDTPYAFDPLNVGYMDYTDCDYVRTKTQGTVGVVYTTYIPLPDSPAYNATVGQFASSIKPALQKCASATYFYEGTDGDQIAKAMKTLFSQATSSVRLTQ